MSIKILVDMNLSPEWVPVLSRHGWESRHWVDVGASNATDRVLMDWASAKGYIVLTHDLDFGTMLALTHSTGPSVIQIRGDDVLPEHMESIVATAITQYAAELEAGALIVVDENRRRVRVLPL